MDVLMAYDAEEHSAFLSRADNLKSNESTYVLKQINENTLLHTSLQAMSKSFFAMRFQIPF